MLEDGQMTTSGSQNIHDRPRTSGPSEDPKAANNVLRKLAALLVKHQKAKLGSRNIDNSANASASAKAYPPLANKTLTAPPQGDTSHVNPRVLKRPSSEPSDAPPLKKYKALNIPNNSDKEIQKEIIPANFMESTSFMDAPNNAPLRNIKARKEKPQTITGTSTKAVCPTSIQPRTPVPSEDPKAANNVLRKLAALLVKHQKATLGSRNIDNSANASASAKAYPPSANKTPTAPPQGDTSHVNPRVFKRPSSEPSDAPPLRKYKALNIPDNSDKEIQKKIIPANFMESTSFMDASNNAPLCNIKARKEKPQTITGTRTKAICPTSIKPQIPVPSEDPKAANNVNVKMAQADIEPYVPMPLCGVPLVSPMQYEPTPRHLLPLRADRHEEYDPTMPDYVPMAPRGVPHNGPSLLQYEPTHRHLLSLKTSALGAVNNQSCDVSLPHG